MRELRGLIEAVNTLLAEVSWHDMGESRVERIRKALAAAEAHGPVAQAEAAVVAAAMDLTKTAHEMGVVDPVSHIAVAVDLRRYASKEHAVFNACAALAKARGKPPPLTRQQNLDRLLTQTERHIS